MKAPESMSARGPVNAVASGRSLGGALLLAAASLLPSLVAASETPGASVNGTTAGGVESSGYSAGRSRDDLSGSRTNGG